MVKNIIMHSYHNNTTDGGDPSPNLEINAWHTLDGCELVPHDHPIHYRIIKVNPDTLGHYVIDLNAGPSIDDMVISSPEGIEKATVDITGGGGYVLVSTKPNSDGTVVFWENWKWFSNSVIGAKIIIHGVEGTLTVKFHIKQVDPIFIPIHIPQQTFAGPEIFKGHPANYNNALLFMDGHVALRYTDN
jgi:hypothetical protein